MALHRDATEGGRTSMSFDRRRPSTGGGGDDDRRVFASLSRSKTGVDARRRRDATERVRLRARVVYARRRVGV